MKKLLNFMKKPLKQKVRTIKAKILFPFRKMVYGGFGKKSDIYRPLMIVNKRKIFVGNNVMIRDFARIEPVTEWNGEEYNPIIKIGDNVSIEQNLHLVCARKVIIEDDVTISANVMIMDNSHQYNDNVDVLQQGLDIKETVVRRGAFIGKNVCVMPGVTLGKYCVVGANAVVTHDVPDYAVVAGVPAKVIKLNKGEIQ